MIRIQLNRIPSQLLIVFALLFFSYGAGASSYLLAQNKGSGEEDDSYDPFADYSEFEEDSQEEADIHFFRNGRFFTLGFILGQRGFTGNLAKLYKMNPAFGIALSYFFDMRFALQFGFNTGDHAFAIPNLPADIGDKSGTVILTTTNFDLKFYINTQNVTKGLADINPYILAGFTQFQRTYMIVGEEGFSRDTAIGFDAGAGLEFPLFRKKMFLGLQGIYHAVSFKDENTAFVVGNDYPTGVKPSGDVYDLSAILGLNF